MVESGGADGTLPLNVPTKMPSPILFRKSPMGRAETAPTDCLPCLFWQAGAGWAAYDCVGSGPDTCRPHIACTFRLKAPPDVSAAAASSSLHVRNSLVSQTRCMCLFYSSVG